MTTDTRACETPLLDLLRSVPLDGRDLYESGTFETQSIPYGRHCHAAAAEITRLQVQADALAVALEAALDEADGHDINIYWPDAARAALAQAGR